MVESANFSDQISTNICARSLLLSSCILFDDVSEQQPPAAARIRRLNKTTKISEKSSQRAHASFENGADPSGTDRGLNLCDHTNIIHVHVRNAAHIADRLTSYSIQWCCEMNPNARDRWIETTTIYVRTFIRWYNNLYATERTASCQPFHKT